jgi:hypothetical protein
MGERALYAMTSRRVQPKEVDLIGPTDAVA